MELEKLNESPAAGSQRAECVGAGDDMKPEVQNS